MHEDHKISYSDMKKHFSTIGFFALIFAVVFDIVLQFCWHLCRDLVPDIAAKLCIVAVYAILWYVFCKIISKRACTDDGAFISRGILVITSYNLAIILFLSDGMLGDLRWMSEIPLLIAIAMSIGK